MAEETTSSWGWGDLLKAAGPIAAAFNPIAGLVIVGLHPVAAGEDREGIRSAR